MVKAEGKYGVADTHIHVLIFPCPFLGHVNSMLKLAQLLALDHLHVTFLNTEHIHTHLQRFTDMEGVLESYPTLQFKTIPDGLPQHHPRSGEQILEIIPSMNLHAKPLLRDILISQSPKVCCFIADEVFGSLSADVADEVGIPFLLFPTIAASSFWTYFSVPKLFESNQLPIRGDEDLDRVITCIPGMENLLRCRDLPSFCRETDSSNVVVSLNSLVVETHQALRARGLILNTFEDLEASVLSKIRLSLPQVFTIGPLHAHLNYRTKESKTTPSTTCLCEMDRSCMTWLDSQPEKSVIYVSFGSIATKTKERLREIWHGLVNSKKRFLWVVRPDMVAVKESGDGVPVELEEGTKERGFMVGWAPQEEVLAHKAVGGFLTHSGWNSTLESVVAGVPMICLPSFGDQYVNSKLASEFWKLGLDMKDLVCDRNVVEKMVNDLMGHRREEFLNSVQTMAMLANHGVSPDGSSYSNLDRLIQYIKAIAP